MNDVKVKYLGNMGFQVLAGEHSFTIDLPRDKEGSDLGMAPPEVFMASLGSCIGVYITKYCRVSKINTDGLEIRLNWSLSDDKTKIKNIDVKIELPNAQVGKRKEALLKVAHHCLIHNTILNPPEIKMMLKSYDIS